MRYCGGVDGLHVGISMGDGRCGDWVFARVVKSMLTERNMSQKGRAINRHRIIT